MIEPATLPSIRLRQLGWLCHLGVANWPDGRPMTGRFRDRRLPFATCFLLLSIASGLTGCGTTSTTTVTDQLLVSDAVDEAIAEISFDELGGENIFLDTTYVQPVKEMGFANTNYIVSSLRQHLLAAGCYLQDDRNQANIIVEPRIGALGTEGQMVTFGIPKSNELSTAASIFANAPVVPAIPEIAFGKSSLSSGAAKLSVFAYYRESRTPVWQSGTRVAKSYSKSTWLLGAGPLTRGTIHDGIRFAGLRLGLPGNRSRQYEDFEQPQIAFDREIQFDRPGSEEISEEVRIADESSGPGGDGPSGAPTGSEESTNR